MMNPQLNDILVQQHASELHRTADSARLAKGLAKPDRRVERASSRRHEPRRTALTLCGHHLAKLDRFLRQAQRAAQRVEQPFEGVSIETDAHGVITVHATGMTPMVL